MKKTAVLVFVFLLSCNILDPGPDSLYPYENLIGTRWWVEGFNSVSAWDFYRDSIVVITFDYYAGMTPSSEARSSRSRWLRIFSTTKEKTDTVATKEFWLDYWPRTDPASPWYDPVLKLYYWDVWLESESGEVYGKYDVYRITKTHGKDLRLVSFTDDNYDTYDLFEIYCSYYREDGETKIYDFSVPMYYYVSYLSDTELRLRNTEYEYVHMEMWNMVRDKPEGIFTKECPVPLSFRMWE